MPSDLQLTIIKARNLPISDQLRDTTESKCIVMFGKAHGENQLAAAVKKNNVTSINFPNHPLQDGAVRATAERNAPQLDEFDEIQAELDDPESNTKQTELIRGLNPEYNKQMLFRSMDDEDLQERYLFIIVVSNDNHIIGSVNIDLSPFLAQNSNFEPTWFPIFNYQKGLRGDLLVKVKLKFVKDENVAKHISSTEVEFFC